MNGYGRFVLPLIVAAGALLYLAVSAGSSPDPANGMHLHEFGMLPVIDKDNGRIKPLESVARTKLMLLSGRQVFYDEQKQEHSAVEWMLDALTSQEPPFQNPAAYEHKVFRIENDQVLSLLALEPRPGSYRYSLNEIGGKWRDFVEAADKVDEKKQRDEKLDLFESKLGDLAAHVRLHLELAQMDTPMLLKPNDLDHPRALRDVLSKYQAAAKAAQDDREAVPAPSPFLVMLLAYQKGRAKDFNNALASYQQQLEATLPAETHRAAFEVRFDDFDPFYQCTLLYVGVFLLTILAWGSFALSRPEWGKTLNWSAFTLGAITFVVHTGALIARMYMMQRPGVFITNLYGTAVFIGWAAGFIGLVLHLIFRNGVGNIVVAVAGFATMIIAQFLSMGEDTMEMMRAVLDTNFWLATHVTSVNFGYACTMVAGILGAIFIVWGLATSTMNKPAVKMMGDALYGVVCCATLFSFTGTVLGGIWADQSWGRFWGWDPKENGAMLIVLWNALILHARWGGLVKQRGMAVLTLMGNIIVIWSWWGVNMLGVGLHAYANADPSMLITVLSAVAVHLGFIAAGLVPLHLWRSFAADAAPPPPPPPMQTGRRRPRHGKGGTGVMPEPA
jgi:ABC-type transport system involved in cytochrome c biogenesis permease subunit